MSTVQKRREPDYFHHRHGPGVGKTLASAIVAEALEADYWKPVQSCMADGTDAFKDYEQAIGAWTGLPMLGRIPAAKVIDRTFVRDQAQCMRPNLLAG